MFVLIRKLKIKSFNQKMYEKYDVTKFRTMKSLKYYLSNKSLQQ